MRASRRSPHSIRDSHIPSSAMRSRSLATRVSRSTFATPPTTCALTSRSRQKRNSRL
ncbi:hypothetical protein BN1708_017024 [Verticillium longisporum]|uniref:Uncharacterized protein n=1 Tax=Verticillium longisporum TaxID=100787 RepID=A0A0G4KFY3_VERLO|nr:hypothetical protein BN1708_017024 [Verticillium longisporum]